MYNRNSEERHRWRGSNPDKSDDRRHKTSGALDAIAAAAEFACRLKQAILS